MAKQAGTRRDDWEFDTEVQRRSPRLLSAALEDHLGANGFEERVGTGIDEQNGLSDQSCWFEVTSPSDSAVVDEIRTELEDGLGMELFSAPRDTGDGLFSTYGVPVDTVRDLFPGDTLLVDGEEEYLIGEVVNVSDGGPWAQKSYLTIAQASRVMTGTERLLVEDHTTDEPPCMYTRNAQAASGYSPYKSGSLHRYPRYAELDISE